MLFYISQTNDLNLKKKKNIMHNWKRDVTLSKKITRYKDLTLRRYSPRCAWCISSGTGSSRATGPQVMVVVAPGWGGWTPGGRPGQAARGPCCAAGGTTTHRGPGRVQQTLPIRYNPWCRTERKIENMSRLKFVFLKKTVTPIDAKFPEW